MVCEKKGSVIEHVLLIHSFIQLVSIYSTLGFILSYKGVSVCVSVSLFLWFSVSLSRDA